MASTVKKTIAELRRHAKFLDGLIGKKSLEWDSRNIQASMREAAELLAVTDYGYRALTAANDRLQQVIAAQTEIINAFNAKQE